ncbi:MAG: transglycosylase domain-containing protein, partial [Pseudomonadota bacterium]
DEILTAYLNRVYLGSGAYGITAAANRYYNKEPTELNLPEAAQLAAALKAPSRINPVANPKASVDRAKIVVEAMAIHDLITEEQAKQAKDSLEQSTLHNIDPASDDIPHYYTDWVLDNTGDYTNRGADGLVVQTSFDPELYEISQTHLNRFFKTEAADKNIGQAAVVIMEFDGTVRTLIGGQSYSVSQFNRAVQAKRQPGSAFKPVVYLAAMAEKGYRPRTLIWDAEFESTDTYRPVNYSGEYQGEVSFRDALAKSLNTPAVRLADDIGIGTVIRTAKELGFSTRIKPDLSSALGSSEVTLMDMTAAYASFANGGQAVYPHTINRLENRDGQRLYERRDYARRPQLFSRRVIADLQYMLRGVVEYGTGRAAYIDTARHIGGKTGTSQDYHDAWFVGYADGYVIGIWMGNDANEPMDSVTGGGPPARLWRAIMSDVLQTRPLTGQDVSGTGRPKPGMFERVLDRWSGRNSRTAGGR